MSFGIFHEKQEGSLCAQHALNSLLQGSYFTAVDLAEVARQLDEDERHRMAEGGLQSSAYLAYMAADSANYDDSGFFSSQVIERALSTFGIEMSAINSELMVEAKANPQHQQAFICWLSSHWFSIRKVGDTWYNLDSMLAQPRMVGEMYLGMLLKELQDQQYLVFVCTGELPQVGGLVSGGSGSGGGGGYINNNDDTMSMGHAHDPELEAALRASMMPQQNQQQQQEQQHPIVIDDDEEHNRNNNNNTNTNNTNNNHNITNNNSSDDLDPELAAAIAMSLQAECNTTTNPNPNTDTTNTTTNNTNTATNNTNANINTNTNTTNTTNNTEGNTTHTMGGVAKQLTPAEMRQRRLNFFDKKEE